MFNSYGQAHIFKIIHFIVSTYVTYTAKKLILWQKLTVSVITITIFWCYIEKNLTPLNEI